MKHALIVCIVAAGGLCVSLMAAERPLARQRSAESRPASVKAIAPPPREKEAPQNAEPPDVQDKPTVKVTRVVEHRVRQDRVRGILDVSDSELRVTLRVEGGDAGKAENVGRIKLETATDDLKTDLRPRTRDQEELGPVHSGNAPPGDAEDRTGFDVDIVLKIPARKAGRITRLKGTFDYEVVTETAAVNLKKLSSLYGKTLDDPGLKEAGLRIQVLDPRSRQTGLFSVSGNGDPKRTVRIRAAGNLEALKNVTIVDEEGESVIESSSWAGVNDTRQFTYFLKSPLNANMTLKIELIAGSHAVTVPFDLTDIELP